MRLRCPPFQLVSIVLALGASCSGPAGPSRDGCDVSYPPQDTSLYILPYPRGTAFRVGQGNCSDGSHARGTAVQFAYDFLMPIGQAIVAARGGEILLVEERFSDGNRTPGHENYVDILHDDGTIPPTCTSQRRAAWSRSGKGRTGSGHRKKWQHG